MIEQSNGAPDTGAGIIKKKSAGGSETLARRGLVRGGGENAMAPTPASVCVIDGTGPGDMSEAEARALYPDDARAQEVITAILDVFRAGEPCPPYFWHTCRNGIDHAVRYVDLGPAVDGRTYLFVVDGRHRKSAAVEVTRERVAEASPLGPLMFPTLAVQIPADPLRAAQIVRDLKTRSNIHVPMAPASIAARCLEYSAGASNAAIAAAVGLRAETADVEVPRYVALALCCREVQEAVNREPDLLAAVGRWRTADGEMKKSVEEQRAWLAARTAPRPVREAKPRRPSPRRLDAFTAQLSSLPAIAQAVGLARGTLTLAEVTDDEVRRAWLASDGAK